jgi:hypothetical protein
MTVACRQAIANRSTKPIRAAAKAFLLLILSFGGTGAFAVEGPGDLGVLDVPGVSYVGNSVVGAFSDSYTFEVASSASFGARLVSISFQDVYGIDGFQTSLWGAGSLLGEMAGTALFGASMISFSYAMLDDLPLETLTEYELRVEGTGIGERGGIYTGSINLAPAVAPVPEPEIYAMMAVGLGVMGWVARRKQRKLAAA